MPAGRDITTFPKRRAGQGRNRFDRAKSEAADQFACSSDDPVMPVDRVIIGFDDGYGDVTMPILMDLEGAGQNDLGKGADDVARRESTAIRRFEEIADSP